MDDKVKEAVKYADGSNKLEDNSLTTKELEQIARDIQSGKSDERFSLRAGTAMKAQFEKYKDINEVDDNKNETQS